MLVALARAALALFLVGPVTASDTPSLSRSNAFRLKYYLLDPSKDFSPSIKDTYVASIHVGAGLALVGSHVRNGRIFYQNGTTDEFNRGLSTVITDGGTPLFPSGLKLVRDGTGSSSGLVSTARLDNGVGTPGVRLSVHSTDVFALDVFLLPETYLACNEPLEYYGNASYVILKQAMGTANSRTGHYQPNIPDACVPVRLIPECAQLQDLPVGSSSNRDNIIEGHCYNNFTPPSS